MQREKQLSSVNSWSILYGLKGNLHGNRNWIFEQSSKPFACLWSLMNKFEFILVMDYTLRIGEGVALSNYRTGTGHANWSKPGPLYHCRQMMGKHNLNCWCTWCILSWRGASMGQVWSSTESCFVGLEDKRTENVSETENYDIMWRLVSMVPQKIDQYNLQ